MKTLLQMVAFLVVCSFQAQAAPASGTALKSLDNVYFKALDNAFTVVKFAPGAALPEWALGKTGQFSSVTYTPDETAVVVESAKVVGKDKKTFEFEDGWKAIEIIRPDFDDAGVLYMLYKVSKILADEKMSLRVISTFETDYVMVRGKDFDNSVSALKKQGYLFK